MIQKNNFQDKNMFKLMKFSNNENLLMKEKRIYKKLIKPLNK